MDTRNKKRKVILSPLFRAVFFFLLPFLFVGARWAAATDFDTLRREMVGELAGHAAVVAGEVGLGALDPRVLEAMGRTPRHLFVPAALQHLAYENRPLPIGYGQTISQPYIVALMTDLLRLRPGDRVLEIGTGSGYQAAVLAEMGVSVWSVEIIEALGKTAARQLEGAGYRAVRSKVADGYHGWPEQAPFDAIIVTAAASHVPPPLVRQLREGGRMVIPVGAAFLTQHLMLVEKDRDGGVRSRQILPVRFVPLSGGN